MATSNVKNDSALIRALVIARHPGVIDQVVTAAVLKHVAGLSRRGSTSTEIVEQTVAYRTELEKRYQEGRGNRALGIEDTTRDSLRLADAAAALAKDLKSVPHPSNTAPLFSAREAMVIAQDIGGSALDLVPVQHWVTKDGSLYPMGAAYDLMEEFNRSLRSMITAFHDECLLNEACRKAAGRVFPDLATIGDEVDVRPGAVVTANPDLFGPVLQNSVQADFTLVIDEDELKESLTSQFRTVTTGLRDDLGDIQNELATLGAQQKDLMTWLNNQAAKEEALSRQNTLQAKVESRWQAAQKGVEAAAAIASLFDDELGSDMRRIGVAGVGVVKTGMALIQAANELSKGLTIATALGTAAATGNYISAAAALIGTFGSARPTPEQVILEQINGLRQDMRVLQAGMEQRFDRVDRALNKIYVDVLGRLDEIDVVLGTLDRKSDQVLDELDGIEATLLRHQSLLANFFQAEHREPLQIAYATALGRPDVAVTPIMTDAEFQAHEGLFRAWASIISGNNIEVPLDAKSTSDVDLRSELEGPALEHIAFLNVVAHKHGWPAFASLNPTDRLHNAHTWMIAAGGYSELEREWPALSAAGTSADPTVRREEVAAPGRTILAALQQIPKRDDGRNLLAEAIENLREKYGEYGKHLVAAEHLWQQELLPAILQEDPELSGMPVWRSDPHREFNRLPGVAAWNQDSAAPEPGLQLDRAVVAGIPAVYRNAAWLSSPDHKNRLRVTVTRQEFHWEDVEIVIPPLPGDDVSGELPPHIPPPEERHIEGTGLRYTATISYSGQGLQESTWETRSPNPLPLASVLSHFTGSKFADIRPDPMAALADIDAARQLLWKGHFYQTLNDWQTTRDGGEIGRAVRVAAAELEGALRLLDCLLELGLPTARSTDELICAALDGRPVWAGGIGFFTATDFLAHLDPAQTTPASAPISKSFPDYLNEVTKVSFELLSEKVEAYQDALEAGEYNESYRDIDLTLARLALAGRLVDLARV